MALVGGQFVNAVQPVPTGTLVHDFPGGNVPTGWISADGQAVSRTNYAELFNQIGTTYGVGDGSTTFNLPKKSIESSVAGYVKMQYQPMVIGHTPLDATTGSAFIRFGTVVQQVGSNYSTSTGFFTCPAAGRYFMHAVVLYNGGYPYIYAMRNQTTQVYTHANLGTAANVYPNIQISAVVNAAVNDTLQFYFNANQGTLYTGAGHSGFSIAYLG